jgi:hypothetical protein
MGPPLQVPPLAPELEDEPALEPLDRLESHASYCPQFAAVTSAR